MNGQPCCAALPRMQLGVEVWPFWVRDFAYASERPGTTKWTIVFRSLAKTKVAWNKPVRERHETRLVYRSKCGRFWIERRDWVAPSRSVSYVLHSNDRSKTYDEETLHDAKGAAQAIADGEM